MIKKNILRLTVFFLALITILNLSGALNSVVALAVEKGTPLSTEKTEQYQESATKNDKKESQFPFAGKTFHFCKYIYNLDDSADYIYVEFKEGGYVIFLRKTLEMMEFSLQGALPYSASATRNYYGGPGSYLQKLDSVFVNMRTNEELDLSFEDAKAYAQQTRNTFLSKTEYRTDLTTTNGNVASEANNFFCSMNSTESHSVIRNSSHGEGDTMLNCGATLIANYEYFLVDPIHRIEGSPPCGPVAAQILLGYHNYYNDRRIIEDKYLLGFDDTVDAVVDSSKNPNHCSDPMTMTPYTIGTRSEATGDNSFYLKLETAIAPSIDGGSSLATIASVMESILNENLSSTDYTLFYNAYLNSIDPNAPKTDINAGHPVLMDFHNPAMRPHAAIAYGYWDDYSNADGSNTYGGYLAHVGWENGNTSWINYSFFRCYISLEVHHEHNYTCVGNIEQTGRKEYKCTECGHRTDAAIAVTDETSYTEHQATISRDQFSTYTYKEYYVTFETAENMLFQTFGNEDTQLYLFDTEYNLLADDEDNGWEDNALFCYTVSANTPYILRVQVSNEFNENDSVNIKFAITPSSYECADYEEIEPMTGTGESWCFDLYYNTTFVLTFTPSISGTYQLKTTPDDDIDTVVYVTDATSTNACICDDNGSTSQISNFTMNLIANKSYFIVVSAADISTEEGFVDFFIRKLS